MTATIEARLRHLHDLEDIRSLLVASTRALDERDIGAYSRLFAKDGEWHGGLGLAKSPERIREMIERALNGVPSEKHKGAFHLMSNMMINIDEDTATAWSRWTWFVPNPDGTPSAARAGYYDDILVREAGHWRFLRRQATTQLCTSPL